MKAALALTFAVLATISAFAQMATADRVEAEAWWPTKPMPHQQYVGPQQCMPCHRQHAATQPSTPMARTGGRAADSEILRTGTTLTFRSGPYSYAITRGGEGGTYTVTDGTQSRTATLAWAFGAGRVGQSFLFERDGTLHEARMSYYGSVHALDFTPNRALASPKDIDEAMSRPIPGAEALRCFACHTTGSASPQDGVDFSALVPGVTCEACHGPGRAHMTAMLRGDLKAGRAAIMNSKTLDAADSVDFCGACHATFWDVKLADDRGIAALRSQPYRLQSSRCWSEADSRLACVTCHNPHQPLVRDTSSYDSRCLSCHATTGAQPSESHPGRACKVQTSNCASCHMPKYEVPGMHFKFTDHLIRVVRTEGL